jgi:hypothetical protein
LCDFDGLDVVQGQVESFEGGSCTWSRYTTQDDVVDLVADNEEIRERVEIARPRIMYLKCKRNPVLAKGDDIYAHFNEIVKHGNVIHFVKAGAPHVQPFHEQVEAAQ